MKKQYDYYETTSFRYVVVLYHDGKEIDRCKKSYGKELNDYIETLIRHGFTRGYDAETVERARLEYEYYRDNKIGASDGEDN